MGCTAGCLNIALKDEKHIELFAKTFVEELGPHLYEDYDEEEVADFFGEEDYAFSLEGEPIFSMGHGHEHVLDFLLSFIKKAPDAELSGDFYSDWDNCCDIVFMKFEYFEGKLSLMRLFTENFGFECEGCGEEVEMSDVEIDFDGGRCLECPECGARLSQQDDEDYCCVMVDDLFLKDGEWEMPEDFEEITEGDEYLTGIAPDEVTNAWKYEDELAAKGILPELPMGHTSWEGLPRTHAMAEQGDEKAIEILAALEKLNTEFSEKLAEGCHCGEECHCGEDCDCCEDDEDSDSDCEECCHCCHCGEKEPEEEPVSESAEEPEAAEESESEEPEAEKAQPAAPKKKSKWWVLPLIIAIIAAGAAAVQLSGLYDIIGLLKGLL